MGFLLAGQTRPWQNKPYLPYSHTWHHHHHHQHHHPRFCGNETRADKGSRTLKTSSGLSIIISPTFAKKYAQDSTYLSAASASFSGLSFVWDQHMMNQQLVWLHRISLLEQSMNMFNQFNHLGLWHNKFPSQVELKSSFMSLKYSNYTSMGTTKLQNGEVKVPGSWFWDTCKTTSSCRI